MNTFCNTDCIFQNSKTSRSRSLFQSSSTHKKTRKNMLNVFLPVSNNNDTLEPKKNDKIPKVRSLSFPLFDSVLGLVNFSVVSSPILMFTLLLGLSKKHGISCQIPISLSQPCCRMQVESCGCWILSKISCCVK